MFNYSPLVPSTATGTQEQLRQMDPRLQRIILQERYGVYRKPTASTKADEVAVIARVTGTSAWESLCDVRSPVTIAWLSPSERIVTGRVLIKSIEHVRKQPFVKSMKAAKKLVRTLTVTTAEIETSNQIAAGTKNKDGKGVVVGIVDSGGDFAHRNFLTEKHRTRMLALWDQTSPDTNKGVNYGRLHRRTSINRALGHPDGPYSVLDYDPGLLAHGTHVMDIAAGNGFGTGIPGVAPAADIIFVEIDSSDTSDSGRAAVGKNFGDSVHLLEAIKFIFEQAGDAPCVINLSVGTNGGPHDGTTLVEQGIDSLLSEKPNRAVVIAASNTFGTGTHAAGTVPANGMLDIPWLVSPDDQTENEMEIWYSGLSRLSVEVIDPSGESLGIAGPGESGTDHDKENNIRFFISNRLDDPNNHDNMIGVWIREGWTGNWIIRLINRNHTEIAFHAWVERDADIAGGQSTFSKPWDNSCTLGSISCSRLAITAGSYNAHKPGNRISGFSSAGPTRDGRLKPEVSAPGQGVVAASSSTKEGKTAMSGTSMASPAVAGAIAVLLGEAAKRNIKLTIHGIRKIVMDSARIGPPAATPDSRYGAGRISVKGMISLLPPAAGDVDIPLKRAVAGAKRKHDWLPRKKPNPPGLLNRNFGYGEA